MYVRHLHSGLRNLCVLLLISRFVPDANSQLENKVFYYLLDRARIIEHFEEGEKVFYTEVVSNFEKYFHSEIEKKFMVCVRKGVVISMREILGLIREGIDPSKKMEPAGAVVTDCAVACEVASGFFPAVRVAVISSGCASDHIDDDDGMKEDIIRMKASWYSLVKPLYIFLSHFRWKTIAIISSYRGGLKIAAEIVGGALRNRSIVVNFHDVDKESDIIISADAVTEEKMTSVLKAAGEQNNILVEFLSRHDHRMFLGVAKKLEMLRGQYAIITINDFQENRTGESAGSTKELQNGLVVMGPWMNRTEYKRRSTVAIAFFRDAAMTLFLGVNATIGTDANYTVILHNMRQVNFTGATGVVAFKPNGEQMMAYSFINIRDGHPVEVLYYMNDDNYKLKTEGMIWPGGGSVAPKDQKTQVAKMSAAVIIIITVSALLLGLCVALFLFCVIYRQLRYRTLLTSTKTWIIPWSDLRFHATIHGRNRSLISMSRSSHATSHGSTTESKTSLVDFSRTEETYFIATYKNSEVITQRLNCASIDLTDRSILNEIYQSLSLSHENIVRYIGICPYQPNVAIVMTVAKRGSLQDLVMSSDRGVFTLDFMASLLLDAAKGMSYLHSTELGSHGRLTSAKCVVDSKWTCQISGCGFRRMKKTRKLLRHFEEHEELYFKGLLWTAPELLRMPEKMRPLYGTKEGDVYSFAIILQEVVLMKAPYPEESTQYYYKDIVGQIMKVSATPFRPALVDADCSDEWIDLIERCWNETPNKRPNFYKIIQDLENLSETQEQTPTGLMEKLMVRTEKHAMNLAGQVKQATAEVELERKRVYNLLHALLPRYVADRLEKGEGVSAESFDSCTMYYADIVGFTKLAAASTPMQVVELLNSLYSKYDEITDAHDTYKVETIGDCYVVASGLPIPNGTKHATEIANLALDVLAFIQSFDIPHIKGTHLETRIGVHSGPVLAGIVGVKMPRYTVFGETTAIAERMEALGVPNMIHITTSTAEILKETKLYVLEKRGEMEVTRERVLTTYFLLGLRHDVVSPEDKAKRKRKSIPGSPSPHRTTVDESRRHSSKTPSPEVKGRRSRGSSAEKDATKPEVKGRKSRDSSAEKDSTKPEVKGRRSRGSSAEKDATKSEVKGRRSRGSRAEKDAKESEVKGRRSRGSSAEKDATKKIDDKSAKSKKPKKDPDDKRTTIVPDDKRTTIVLETKTEVGADVATRPSVSDQALSTNLFRLQPPMPQPDGMVSRRRMSVPNEKITGANASTAAKRPSLTIKDSRTERPSVADQGVSPTSDLPRSSEPQKTGRTSRKRPSVTNEEQIEQRHSSAISNSQAKRTSETEREEKKEKKKRKSSKPSVEN